MALLEYGLTLAAVAAIVAAYRAVRAWQVERAFDAKFGAQRNARGVIAGAESFMLAGSSDRAIVLLHGFNDSPQTMRSPAAAMHAAGWTVYAPVLPGHGRSPRDFAASSAEEWITAARTAVREALQRHQQVAVGGLSLGGALAAIVASEEPSVKAAVLFAPFLVHSRRLGAIAAFWPLITLGVKYLTGGSATRAVRDPAARATLIAYGCSTPHLLREVQRVVRQARAALPGVRQPVWIAQSSDDYRIPDEQAQGAFDQLGSGDKRLHWTTGNGHVITVDHGHEELSAEAVRWLESRVPAR
ncbi:MAG: alpha/beta fold hydrolase [Gemmatimonadaceae bacterium]|nr:alpha/beta fold hydrolase [Gemmatimonadaceae bacterium]